MSMRKTTCAPAPKIAMSLLAEHQIDNARLLATADKGRPRSASLRRAVSTAYYAVFQTLCGTCADTLVGWRQPWSVYTPVFRAPDHYATAQALREPFLAAIPHLQRLGLLLRELQGAREWADYNPEPRPDFKPGERDSLFTRQEALSLIDAAVEAIAILEQLDEDTRLKLAVRLVARIRK
jgi:hypothetical protein